MAGTEGFDLHVRKAVTLADQGARDWEAIVALDPTNQIAWNNLVSARLGAFFWSYSSGDIRGAREQLRLGLAVERRVKESAMIGTVLSLVSGYQAWMEANAGNRETAEAAVASNQRFIDMATLGLPPDSFGRAYLPEFLGYYGYPTTGFGYGMLAIPFAARDYETVRKEARASVQRLEEIKNVPPSRTLDRNRTLEVAYRTAAEASYRLKDYTVADADIKRALEIHKTLPVRTLAEERDATEQIMLAAEIAARMGRYADAQRMIEPVLKFHRDLYARGNDNEDLFQHVEFARALYVSALVGQGQKTQELIQSAAIIDGLPPAMRRLIAITVLRDDIAEELKKRRG